MVRRLCTTRAFVNIPKSTTLQPVREIWVEYQWLQLVFGVFSYPWGWICPVYCRNGITVITTVGNWRLDDADASSQMPHITLLHTALGHWSLSFPLVPLGETDTNCWWVVSPWIIFLLDKHSSSVEEYLPHGNTAGIHRGSRKKARIDLLSY